MRGLDANELRLLAQVQATGDFDNDDEALWARGRAGARRGPQAGAQDAAKALPMKPKQSKQFAKLCNSKKQTAKQPAKPMFEACKRAHLFTQTAITSLVKAREAFEQAMDVQGMPDLTTAVKALRMIAHAGADNVGPVSGQAATLRMALNRCAGVARQALEEMGLQPAALLHKPKLRVKK